MEDEVEEDTKEAARFVKKYEESFTKKTQMEFFVVGFLSAKGYSYSVAEDIAFDITEELWT